MPTTPGLEHHIYGVTMRENQYIVVCSATSVEFCLCLKVPREFPKAAEAAKKVEAEAVLKKLLASGMSADEILEKLK